MSATTFDPLRTAKDLHAAGIERDHAEAMAEAMGQAAAAGHGELATKADLAAQDARFYRALWIQGIGIVGIILAALRFLPV